MLPRRLLPVLLFTAMVFLLPAARALAQDWPAYAGDPFERGPGQYLAWWKLLIFGLLVLFWIRTTDWIGRDSWETGESVGMLPVVWNHITVFSFVVAVILTFLVPIFAVGALLMFVAWIGPFLTYTFMRNARVTDDLRVFTPTHLKQVFSGKTRKPVEQKAAWEEGPTVDLKAMGAHTSQDNQGNLITARQSPGYITTKELVAEAIDKRADRILLDYTRDAVGIRLDVDGVWHNLEPRDRESGDVMLAVMKKLANLNINERRVRQDGEFGAEYKTVKYRCQLTSQGTKTGERVLIHFRGREETFKSLDEIGMREKMAEQYKEMLGAKKGLIVISALPSGGLTTTWAASLKVTDRYMRDFVSIVRGGSSQPYVENVEIVEFNSNEGEAAEAKLPNVILKQPDVIVVPEVENGRTIDLLCEQVNHEDRLAIVSLRGKDAADALLRMLALKPNVDGLANAITSVLCQRLVRRLCDACKQPYEPSTELLQKLRLPPGRVKVLFRPYQPPPPGSEAAKDAPETCPACLGIGYRGRTAVFELLNVDDHVRQIMAREPSHAALTQAARQAGCPSLQDEGILLVAKGVTSLAELQRAMKQ